MNVIVMFEECLKNGGGINKFHMEVTFANWNKKKVKTKW